MYDYGTVGVVYTALHFAVLASVRYWLYRDRLRVSAKWMYFIVSVIAVVFSGFWILVGGIPDMAYDTYRVILAVLMFALSCFIIKAPAAEHAFSYAFILAYTASVETIASYARLHLVPGSPAYSYPVISTLIIIITFIPGVRCLNKMISRLSAMGSDRVWGWLDLACYSFLSMNMLVTLPHPSDMGVLYPVGRGLMLIGMAGVYKASVRVMDAMRFAANAQAELHLTQRRVTMQQSYYDRMIAQMDDVRRMRHDLRHHRSALSALIKNGDMAALSTYIDDVSVPEDVLPITGSLAADSVLLYYMDEARSLGVRMETNLSLGRETPLSDPDLCVIMGNLLENAVEAQKRLPSGERYILVTAKGSGQSLVLAVDNRFVGTLMRDEHGEILSCKDGEGHGLGISSVRVVCEKYGGIFQIETEGNMFMAGVVIGV